MCKKEEKPVNKEDVLAAIRGIANIHIGTESSKLARIVMKGQHERLIDTEVTTAISATLEAVPKTRNKRIALTVLRKVLRTTQELSG